MADVKFYKQNGTSGTTEGSIIFDTSDKTIKLVEGGDIVPYKGIIESSILESDNAVSAKAVYNYATPRATVVSGLYSAMFTDNRKLYLAEDCDCFYAAHKKWTVTGTDNNGTTYSSEIYASLFDGTLESVVPFASGTNTILIDLGESSITYAEGKLLVCIYHTFAPESVSARIYSKSNSTWYDVNMTHMGEGGSQWFEGTTPTIIYVSKIELTITVTEDSKCQLNNLLYILQRPDYVSSSVRKYRPETLYHNLTVPSLTINGTNFTGYAGELKDFTSKVYDATFSRTANTFLAAPDGSNGAATFRAISRGDLDNVLKNVIISTPQSINDLGITIDASAGDAIKAVIKTLCQQYPNVICGMFIGQYTPNSNGMYMIFIYNTNKVNSETGLPEYSFGWAEKYGANTYYFGTTDYNFNFAKSVADNELINASVKTASQLTWADWS